MAEIKIPVPDEMRKAHSSLFFCAAMNRMHGIALSAKTQEGKYCKPIRKE